MKQWKEYYKADKTRYSKLKFSVRKVLYFYRKAHFTKNKLLRNFYRAIFRMVSSRYLLEISSNCKIGKGLYLGHMSSITINGNAIIGENCNIHKGVTIGQENRGPRKGCPTIGNRVWIGINSTIVGNITIGDDVLIAPNSFVNCDVPSHSVVFGNPCIIKHKDNATEEYINNLGN